MRLHGVERVIVVVVVVAAAGGGVNNHRPLLCIQTFPRLAGIRVQHVVRKCRCRAAKIKDAHESLADIYSSIKDRKEHLRKLVLAHSDSLPDLACCTLAIGRKCCLKALLSNG